MGDVEAGRLHRSQHGFGRRRRGGEELDRVGKRPLFRGRRVEQRGHHDRRATKMRHLVIGDRIVHRPRAHLAQAHMGAGNDRYAPGKAPAVAMKHGQRPEIDAVLAHAAGEDVADGKEIGAAVVIDDAFGIACRA